MLHLYLILIEAVFVFSLGLACFLWQMRYVPGTKAFVFMLSSIAAWSLALTLENIFSDHQSFEFWVKAGFAFLSLIPAAWLVFITQYNHARRKFKSATPVILLIIPVFSILMLFTKQYSVDFLKSAFSPNSYFVLQNKWQTTVFWLITAAILSLIASGIIFLAASTLRKRGYQRINNFILFLTSSMLFTTTMLYLINQPDVNWLGLLSFAYLMSFGVYLWAIFRCQMFGFSPIINKSLMPWLNDGIVMLDEEQRILYVNPMVEKEFNISAAVTYGRQLAVFLPQVTKLLNVSQDMGEQRLETAINTGTVKKTYEIRSIFMERQTYGSAGWFLIFHDVSQRIRNREMIVKAKNEWESTFDALPSMVILADKVGYIFRCNRKTCEVFNTNYTNIIGKNIAALFFGNGHPASQSSFPQRGEIRFPALEGWFELAAYPLDTSDEQPAIVYIIQDITSRKEAERERNLYARRLEGINKIDHAILSLRTPQDIANAVLQQIQELSISQYAAVWLIEQDARQVSTLASLDTSKPGLSSFPASCLPDEIWRGEYAYGNDLKEKEKPSAFDRIMLERGWVSYVLAPLMANEELLGVLCLSSSQPARYSSSQHDILYEMNLSLAVGLQNAVLFDKIQHLAITDPLTGLYNRRYFFEVAERELERSRRFNFHLSLMMMDIDFFKKINDKYGHLAGDHVLQVLATTLNRNIRKYDILARYGGEEFILLLPRTESNQAREMAERLQSVVQSLIIDAGKSVIQVTLSIGTTSINGRLVKSIEPLIEYADRAMYTAKSSGRDRIVSLDLQ